MKRIVAGFMAFMLMIALAISVHAHGGRTDSSGGHKDNENVSGLGWYHYHCGGHPAHLHNNGVCPYAGKDISSETEKNSGAASDHYKTNTYKSTSTKNAISNNLITVILVILFNVAFFFFPVAYDLAGEWLEKAKCRLRRKR